MSKKKAEPEQKPAVKRRRRVSEPDSPLVRTFCALTLDEAATAAIANAVDEHRFRMTAFNWVEPEKWHVTLKFYGDVPTNRLPELGRALSAVAGPPIPTAIRGVGAFPDLRGPRVLWVGVDDARNLITKLYRRVNDVSSNLGYEPEDRRFKPHISVARVKKGRSHPVARELTPLMGQDIAETVLKELVLMTSELTPDGPRYTAVKRIRLGGGAA